MASRTPEAIGAEYPRYGYELLHGMLKAEGLVVNEKKTYPNLPRRETPSQAETTETLVGTGPGFRCRYRRRLTNAGP